MRLACRRPLVVIVVGKPHTLHQLRAPAARLVREQGPGPGREVVWDKVKVLGLEDQRTVMAIRARCLGRALEMLSAVRKIRSGLSHHL